MTIVSVSLRPPTVTIVNMSRWCHEGPVTWRSFPARVQEKSSPANVEEKNSPAKVQEKSFPTSTIVSRKRGTHYFMLRKGGGQIFVTSLHFTMKKRPCLPALSQPSTGYCTPTHLPSYKLNLTVQKPCWELLLKGNRKQCPKILADHRSSDCYTIFPQYKRGLTLEIHFSVAGFSISTYITSFSV